MPAESSTRSWSSRAAAHEFELGEPLRVGPGREGRVVHQQTVDREHRLPLRGLAVRIVAVGKVGTFGREAGQRVAPFGPVDLDTPIGGKDVSITLKNRYQLEWRQYGPFWFLEVQGQT